MLLLALVVSRMDYCNALHGLPMKLVCKLQQVQKKVAKLLSGVSKDKHISATLATLHWLPVHFHARFKAQHIKP